MSLLNDLYKDIRSDVNWTTTDGVIVAMHEHSMVAFTPDSTPDCWVVTVSLVENLSDTVKSIISKFISDHSPKTMLIECTDHQRGLVEYVSQIIGDMFNYGVELNENSILLDRDIEFIVEEPNSSLMYHRLFPNKRLNAELESYGYKFRDGSGMKLARKHMGSTNRNNGPSERRTMQSIIIFKDGKMFRKIPKQKWNQLVDTSDSQSESWGVTFQRKIIAAERKGRTDNGIEVHFK